MNLVSAPFSDPGRPAPRIRPLKALWHFRRLVEDKEDTAQVFLISDCLPNAGFLALVRSFCESREGRTLMSTEPELFALLDDHAALRALPTGSVAHAYVDFMQREQLSAAGLVAEDEKTRAGQPQFDDQSQWFYDRLRDTHDLLHVLTGYGRDALGEQCVLGFSWGQYRSWTDLFLSWVGALELKRRVRSDAPVFAAVREGQRNGKVAGRVFAQEIRALLAEPLDQARTRLNIGAPGRYEEAHAAYRVRGIDPYDFMAAVT